MHIVLSVSSSSHQYLLYYCLLHNDPNRMCKKKLQLLISLQTSGTHLTTITLPPYQSFTIMVTSDTSQGDVPFTLNLAHCQWHSFSSLFILMPMVDWRQVVVSWERLGNFRNQQLKSCQKHGGDSYCELRGDPSLIFRETTQQSQTHAHISNHKQSLSVTAKLIASRAVPCMLMITKTIHSHIWDMHDQTLHSLEESYD